MKTSVFQTKVQDLRRIVIPKPICDALKIRKGDTVEVTIKRVENAFSPSLTS